MAVENCAALRFRNQIFRVPYLILVRNFRKSNFEIKISNSHSKTNILHYFVWLALKAFSVLNACGPRNWFEIFLESLCILWISSIQSIDIIL